MKGKTVYRSFNYKNCCSAGCLVWLHTRIYFRQDRQGKQGLWSKFILHDFRLILPLQFETKPTVSTETFYT